MEPKDVAIRLHSALHEVERLLQEVDTWYHRIGEKSIEGVELTYHGLPVQLVGEQAYGEVVCAGCHSEKLHFVAHPDDPEEIFNDFLRCDVCSCETDWYECHKAWKKKHESIENSATDPRHWPSGSSY